MDDHVRRKNDLTKLLWNKVRLTERANLENKIKSAQMLVSDNLLSKPSIEMNTMNRKRKTLVLRIQNFIT